MRERGAFDVANFTKDKCLWDVYNVNVLDEAYDIWLRETIRQPRCQHAVYLASNHQPLWINDIEEREYRQPFGKPRQIWIADREEWETPWMVPKKVKSQRSLGGGIIAYEMVVDRD